LVGPFVVLVRGVAGCRELVR